MTFNALMKSPFGTFVVRVIADSEQAAVDLLEDQYEESYVLDLDADRAAIARERQVWAEM